MAKYSSEMQDHITRIGFKTVSNYNEWCIQNGFTTKSSKSLAQQQLELSHANIQRVSQSLKQSKQSKSNFRHSIEEIRKLEYKTTNNKVLNAICETYNNKVVYWVDKETSKLFLDVILFLEQKTKLFDTDQYVLAIAKVVNEKDSWIRSYETWQPKSYNVDKQFSLFIRHLFTKYRIPTFLDSLWFNNNTTTYNRVGYQRNGQVIKNEYWFIHICSGKNILTCANFIQYYPMTKKMAHYFMLAPSNFNVKEAWCYGKVMALGGSIQLTKALIPTKWANCKDEEFSLSVIRFFVANPMLDYSQIGPIIDYVWGQKFEVQRATNAVMQPNFSMTGRTVQALLQQVERWHRELGKAAKGKVSQWNHSSIKDFELVEGMNENKKIWRITEILTSKDLLSEGRLMKHCVASYVSSCAAGSSFIWSMTLNDTKLLTIEVTKNKSIGQVRGLCNRLATQKERSIMKLWAAKENITISSYLW